MRKYPRRFSTLTCVPELLIAVHGEDDQQVAQDVDHDGENEEAAQSCGDPRRAAQDGIIKVQRGVVQVRTICDHCTGYTLQAGRATAPQESQHMESRDAGASVGGGIPQLCSSIVLHMFLFDLRLLLPSLLLLLLLLLPSPPLSQLRWISSGSPLCPLSLLRPCAIHFACVT